MFSMKAAALLLVASALVQVALGAKATKKSGPSKQFGAGTPVSTVKDFTFHVGIAINGSSEPSCHGVLVDATVVLTSASCASLGSVTVILAALNYTTFSPPTVRIDAEQVLIHSGYNPATGANDLALVKVPFLDKIKFEVAEGTKKFKVVEKIKAVFNDDKKFDATFIGKMVNVTGVGKNADASMDVFVSGSFLVLSNTNCSALANEFGVQFNASAQGCIAVNGTANAGPCAKSAGAPVTQWSKTGTTLVGIMTPNTTSVACDDSLNFRIFTRVSVFAKTWIDKEKGFKTKK